MIKKNRERPEVKLKLKEYAQRPEVKEMHKKYRESPRGQAKKREYNSRPETKAKIKQLRDNLKFEIHSYYSKLHSNSDIPCCNCCGETITAFLAIDHIAGKKQMNSEPELVKLGYSSKLEGGHLQSWIKKNNFPKGFQILCHNCNFAKGIPGNKNKCPHETKRLEETFAMMEEQSSFEV